MPVIKPNAPPPPPTMTRLKPHVTGEPGPLTPISSKFPQSSSADFIINSGGSPHPGSSSSSSRGSAAGTTSYTDPIPPPLPSTGNKVRTLSDDLFPQRIKDNFGIKDPSIDVPENSPTPIWKEGVAYIKASGTIFPVRTSRFSTDGETWEVYSPSDPTKPGHAVKFEATDWKPNNNTGLQGGAPKHAQQLQFLETMQSLADKRKPEIKEISEELSKEIKEIKQEEADEIQKLYSDETKKIYSDPNIINKQSLTERLSNLKIDQEKKSNEISVKYDKKIDAVRKEFKNKYNDIEKLIDEDIKNFIKNLSPDQSNLLNEPYNIKEISNALKNKIDSLSDFIKDKKSYLRLMWLDYKISIDADFRALTEVNERYLIDHGYRERAEELSRLFQEVHANDMQKTVDQHTKTVIEQTYLENELSILKTIQHNLNNLEYKYLPGPSITHKP